MEVLVISECHNDFNKENIPSSLVEKVTSNCSKLKSCTRNVKRSYRRPLRDITHLFNSPVQSTSAAFTRFQRPASLSYQAIVRGKRKVDGEIDSLQKHSSKILRWEFR